ncbi:MAG TPA: response regulator [Nitrososphaeraceae archaeon]|nr:response regulator [Nitrososphaeraceae archaeon]
MKSNIKLILKYENIIFTGMAAKAIAIIDEEADLVNLFSEALKLNHFKVCGFTNPLEALNHIEKNPEQYGLVISDFKMPVMNGNELCTKLININPNFKVILMSAYADVKYDKERFLFVNKPIPIAQLLGLVKEQLSELSIKL